MRTGKVRLEFGTLAFVGPDSEPAVTDEFVDDLLVAFPGLDAERARRDGESAAADRLLAAAEARAERHGIDSTPSFLLTRTGGKDHRVLSGVQDYATLRAALDDLIAG